MLSDDVDDDDDGYHDNLCVGTRSISDAGQDCLVSTMVPVIWKERMEMHVNKLQ